MWSSKQHSRIYKNHDQTIVIDSDREHCEGWFDEKSTQQKQAVQLLQIDRILHGVIRERMIGDIINRKNQLLTSAYGDFSKPNHTIGDWTPTNRRRRFTAGNTMDAAQPFTRSSFRISRESQTNKTLDRELRIRKRVSRTAAGESKPRKLTFTEKKLQLLSQQPPLPGLTLSNNASFQEFFRRVANVGPKGILVEGKVTRQQLKLLFKPYKINQEILDRFMTFFDFPSTMFYRQFITQIENILNKTALREINFLIFQLLDRNKDGVVNTSDLFKFLGENGGGGVLIQRDVFLCSGYIQNAGGNTSANNFLTDFTEMDKKDLSTDQMLIRNHNMRLETYRELVKEDNSQIVTCPIMKSTIYHQTFNALEHNANVRLKNYNLEVNKSQSKLDSSGLFNSALLSTKADQMTLLQFYKLFAEDRPGIFYFIIETMAGQKFEHLQSR